MQGLVNMCPLLDSVEVGKPVPVVESPKMKWRLRVTTMHGDADHYEKIKMDFSELSHKSRCRLELYLKMLEAFFKLSWNEGCEQSAVLSAIMSATGLADGPASDMWYELVGYDITYGGGQWATPDKVELTFFDDKGIEYTTKLPFKTTRP